MKIEKGKYFFRFSIQKIWAQFYLSFDLSVPYFFANVLNFNLSGGLANQRHLSYQKARVYESYGIFFDVFVLGFRLGIYLVPFVFEQKQNKP